MENETTQPQVNEQEVVKQDIDNKVVDAINQGVHEMPEAAISFALQSGAETTSETKSETPPPVTPPQPQSRPQGRVYTEDEVRRIQSQSDQATAKLKQYTARLAMQQEIAQIAQSEQSARAKDRQSIEQGLMTEDEASKRIELRLENLKAIHAQRNIAAQTQQLTQQNQQIRATNEVKSMISSAQLLGETLGIDPKTLLSDPACLRDPEIMERTAVMMAIGKKTKGRQEQSKGETYDQGPGIGASGGTLNNMSPTEKIKWGLTHQKK